MSAQEIEAISKEREIPYLVHFTQLSNLESILEYGIHPRCNLNGLLAEITINDELRLDHHDDSISLSIAHPNSSMFYKYRQEKGEDWVILVISPNVLWEMDCAFCKHNAADSRISNLPVDDLKTPEAFQGMFEEIEGIRTREEQRLKKYDPTDVQAEILVFGEIPKERIAALVFHDEAARQTYQHLIGDRKVYVHNGGTGLFAARTYVREY